MLASLTDPSVLQDLVSCLITSHCNSVQLFGPWVWSPCHVCTLQNPCVNNLFFDGPQVTSLCFTPNTQPEIWKVQNFGQVLQDFAPASTGKPLLILALTDGEAMASTALAGGCLLGDLRRFSTSIHILALNSNQSITFSVVAIRLGKGRT